MLQLVTVGWRIFSDYRTPSIDELDDDSRREVAGA